MPVIWWIRLFWLCLFFVGGTLRYVPDLGAHDLHDQLAGCRGPRTRPDGSRRLLCPPEATARPVASSNRPLTATRTPSAPAATTAAATAARPSGSVAPYAGAPLCAPASASQSLTEGHDPRAYHGLWDSARGCHYDHHHGDDPHTVDEIFGADFYHWAGGEISYPWQTSNPSTGCLENDCKHQGYFWLVRRDLPCVSQYGDGCIVHFRALTHALPHTHDTTVRYHSAWLEAVICDEANPTRCGLFRSGGWQDTGDLLVDSRPVLDYANNFNRFKLHYDSTGNPQFGTWYSGSPGGEEQRGGLWQVVLELGDMWTRTSAADPHRIEYFCADPHAACQTNGSRLQPHLIGFVIPHRYRAAVDPDGDGLANYAGYADRWGTLVSGCTALSLDCVPVVLEHVPVSPEYQGRFDYREYDIFFNGQTSGWIQPPD